jgi:hypothetical protein
MSPLGLLDLWPFLFLFTYISPGIKIRNATGLVIPGETYVNRNKKGHRSSNPRETCVNRNKKHHRSSNPRGDICK